MRILYIISDPQDEYNRVFDVSQWLILLEWFMFWGCRLISMLNNTCIGSLCYGVAQCT